MRRTSGLKGTYFLCIQFELFILSNTVREEERKSEKQMGAFLEYGLGTETALGGHVDRLHRFLRAFHYPSPQFHYRGRKTLVLAATMLQC